MFFTIFLFVLNACADSQPGVSLKVDVPATPGNPTYTGYPNQAVQNLNQAFSEKPTHPSELNYQETMKRGAEYNIQTNYWKEKIVELKASQKVALPIKKRDYTRHDLSYFYENGKRIYVDKIDDVEIDYIFKSGNLSLERTYKDLYKIDPAYRKERAAKEIGLTAVREADESFINGEMEDGLIFKQIAEDMLDIAVGIDPVTSLGRSAYELFTGKNFVTGKHLDSVDQGLNAATLLSLGTAGTGIKLIKIGSKFAHFEKTRHAVMSAGKFIQKGYWKLTGHGTKISPHIFKNENGKILDKRMYEVVEYFIPWEK
jgi:Pre-toxin TG